MSENALPSLADAFPSLVDHAADPIKTAAADSAKTSSAGGRLTRYELPEGATIVVTRPTNRVHRTLVEDPAQQIKQVFDTIAANCITAMEFPAGYTTGDEASEPASTLSFDPKVVKAEHYNRLDDLSMMDVQAFSAAFERENSPTRGMVESITAAIAKAKSAKK